MSDPTPIEARQAALLAHSLARGPGHDWSKVDADVREAVYALKPEHAPAPRDGLLEEALAEVLEGPFAVPPSAEELAEAAAFAEALEGPEPTVDPQLQDALFALAPDRAPAPNLSIDDILDSVSTGPFAPVIRITGEFPAVIAPPTNLREAVTADAEPAPAAEVVSLAAHRPAPKPQPARRAPRPRWFLPAMGALAAAAATLLFVVPGLQMSEMSPEPPLAGAPAPRQEAAGPAATDAPMAKPSSSATRTSPKKEKRKQVERKPAEHPNAPAPAPPPADRWDPAEEAPAGQAQSSADRNNAYGGYGGEEQGRRDTHNKDAAKKADVGTGRSAGPSLAKRESDARPEPEVTDQFEALGYIATEGAVGGGGLTNSGVLADDLETNTGSFADGDLAGADAAIEDAWEFAEEEAEPPPEPVAVLDEDDDYAANTAAPAAGAPAAYAEEKQALGEAVDEVVALESRKRPKRSLRAGSSSSAPAAAPAADYGVEDATTARDLGLIDPRLAEKRPDLASRWAEAQSREVRGDYSGAARLLWSLAQSDSDPDVVVDAAVRSGRLWLTVGNLTRARQALERARQMSPTTRTLTAARSDLARRVESEASRSADRPTGD